MTRFLALLGDSRRWRLVMVQEGFLAPDFTLDSLAGDQVALSALRGKLVLFNLWASWCGPCCTEMPAIDKVYRTNRSRGFEVLAVDATNQDSEPDARAFGAAGPHVPDPT